jgi:hypothetical protein
VYLNYIEDIWLVQDQLIKYLQGRFKGAFSKIGLNLTDKGKETITRFKDTTFTITITISNWKREGNEKAQGDR